MEGMIICESAEMKEVWAAISKVAKRDCPVLITGESGTGKELVAKAIHEHSPRKSCPFIAVNASSIPDTLFSSEMFGCEKGAYTGSVKKRKGLILSAEGGTLFLDEIGEMPLSTQAHLLRALENKELISLGSDQPKAFNVRVIAASNCDFEDRIAKGSFRSDLFSRLNVFPIILAPLRQRKADILPLAEYFIRRKADEFGIAVPELSREAEAYLLADDWPGNVRELQSVIESTLIHWEGVETLEIAHLDSHRRRPARSAPKTGSVTDSSESLEKAKSLLESSFSALRSRDIAIDLDQTTKDLRLALIFEAMMSSFPDIGQAAGKLGIPRFELVRIIEEAILGDDAGKPPPAISFENVLSEKQEQEKKAILLALEKCSGSKSQAARDLGKSNSWLTYRVEKYQLGNAIEKMKGME